MSAVRACEGRQINCKASFLTDQRGAVAFEMPIVYLVLIFSLLLPLADVAIAGFQYISAWQALSAFGQYIQYNPPPNLADTSTWISTVHPKAQSLGVSDPQILCGDNQTGCSNAALWPKYYSYTTTVTLTPMVLRSVLCPSGNANGSCTYTLPHSERFQ